MGTLVRRLLTLILPLGLLLAPWSALAQQTTLAISPGFGPPGTQFVIVVTGLLPEAPFSVAVYRHADQRLMGVEAMQADAGGSLVASHDTTGYQPGRYEAVITYLARGNRVVSGGFTVARPSGAAERFFPETGFTVRGRFLTYWETNGALELNGYPLTEERDERLEDGRVRRVQYFERVRMEHHPENAPPYDVLLGQFGRRLHPLDPPAAPIVGAHYFAETGHNLADVTPDRQLVVNFGRFWDNNGGLRQFGYPISELIEEQLEDGRVYTVQYFERARFEYHPEHAGTPYEVLLGQFGRRILTEVDAGR